MSTKVPWVISFTCMLFASHHALMHRVEEYPGKNADKLANRRLAQVYTPGTVLDGPMLVSVCEGFTAIPGFSFQFGCLGAWFCPPQEAGLCYLSPVDLCTMARLLIRSLLKSCGGASSTRDARIES
jgi:hypothetical protein